MSEQRSAADRHRAKGFATKAIHAGFQPDPATGAKSTLRFMRAAPSLRMASEVCVADSVRPVRVIRPARRSKPSWRRSGRNVRAGVRLGG